MESFRKSEVTSGAFAKGRSEQAMSLVEVMVAVAILTLGGWASMMAMARLSETRELAAHSSAAVEVDQLVRYETIRVLDRFQRIITEKVSNTNIVAVCNDSYRDFLDLVQLRFRMGQTFVFGNLDDLVDESDIKNNKTGLKEVVEEAYASRSSTTGAKGIEQYVGSGVQVTSSHKALNDAFNRCRTSQSITDDNPQKLADSFYFCGHSNGVLVEVKGVFWDYINDRSLNCTGMNEFGGRGVRAMYSVFHYSRGLVKGKPKFYVQNFDGRLYVAKQVTDDFHDVLSPSK